MAPSSPPTARKPSHLSVIHDEVFKKDHAHIKARRLLTDAGKQLHGNEASTMESATSSPALPNTDPWGSVERPEDICELNIDVEWDLEEAGWLAEEYTCVEETAPDSDNQLHLDTPPEGESVWNEADCFLAGASESGQDLLELLEDHPVPSRDFEEDSAGVWVAPQEFGF